MASERTRSTEAPSIEEIHARLEHLRLVFDDLQEASEKLCAESQELQARSRELLLRKQPAPEEPVRE